MNRKVSLFIFYFLCICIIAVFVIFIAIKNFASNKPTENSSFSATITPYSTASPNLSQAPGSTTDPLYGVSVTNTYPQNNQMNIPVNSQLTIALNKQIARENIHYSIAPDITSSFTLNGNTITIQPNQLQPGTLYFVSLQLSRLTDGSSRVFSYSFTTAGTTSTPIPPVNETLAPQAENSYQLQNDPDIYLSNHTPYSGSDFSISSSYNLQLHHFQFTVQLTGSDKTQSKNDFISWAQSLGLTSTQIQGLDITYQ